MKEKNTTVILILFLIALLALAGVFVVVGIDRSKENQSMSYEIRVPFDQWEKISPKSINPHACLSLMIQDVKSNDHSILVIGREDYPQKQFDSDHIKNGMPFSRRIEVMTDWTGRKR